MIPAFEPLRQISTGEVLGADTYLNIVAARSNWLYGQAHAPEGLQRQPYGSTTGALTVWEADTRRVAEHPTLNFCARINLVAGGSAQLQYYGDDDAWHDFATNGSDINAGDRWFCATENLTYTVSALAIPDDEMLHLRFIIAGSGTASTATVYRAYLSGTTGLTAWPASMPTFVDGAVPTAANFDAFRVFQLYLQERAERPNTGSEIGTAWHTQTGSTVTLYRWAFTYSGMQRLYCYLTVWEYLGGTVDLYINDEKYPAAGTRLNGGETLIPPLVGNSSQGYNIDLSGLGLTKGTRYQIELSMTRSGDNGCLVEVGGLQLGDLGGVMRTYTPKGDWAHGDRPTAAQLNTMVSDVVGLKDAAASESPIWPQHQLQPFLVWAEQGTLRYQGQRYRITHRWRYLRWRGAGKVISADRLNEQMLSDSATAGESQTLDLDSLEWLDYGMSYLVESYGTNVMLVAYEDYE